MEQTPEESTESIDLGQVVTQALGEAVVAVKGALAAGNTPSDAHVRTVEALTHAHNAITIRSACGTLVTIITAAIEDAKRG